MYRLTSRGEDDRYLTSSHRYRYISTVAVLPVLLVIYFVVHAIILGNPGFSVDKTQHGLRVSRVELQLNPVKTGDLILEVNGVPYEQLLGGLLLRSRQLKNPTVSLLRDSRQLTFSLQTVPHDLGSIFSSIWLHLLLISIFLGLGLAALFRAPPDKLTTLFFFMLCGFSGSIASTLASQLGLFVPPLMAVSFFGIACCNWLAFGAWAHFASCFPTERDITKNRPWLPMLFYLLPPALTILLALYFADPPAEFWCWVQRLRNIFLPVIIIGSFCKHLVDFFKLPPNIVRNQIKFPLAAYWFSFGPYFFLYLLPNLILDQPLAYFRTVAMAFLILPMAYLFALLRYRLFAVDKVLSRILAYIVLVTALTVLYSAFILAVKRWFWGKAVLSEELFLIFLVIVIVTFNPALSRIQGFINRFIFGNIPLPPSMLHSLSKKISTALKIKDLVPIVTREFKDTFGLDKVALAILDRKGRLHIHPAKYSNDLPDQSMVQQIIGQLSTHDEYILCHSGPGDSPLTEELDGLADRGWSMAFRLKGTSSSPGLLWIGEKRNRRVFNDDDIIFLATLANHIGVALENSFRFTSLADSKRTQKAMFEKMLQQEKMAAIGEMSTVLAHELKNPLAVIRSSAQLLAAGNAGAEIMEEMLDYIVAEVDSLNLTINSLLSHARHRAPVIHGIELQKTIPALLEKWQLCADHQPGIQITCDITEQLPVLHADMSQLGQILLNVIRNSEEAMGRSGKIQLSIKDDKAWVVLAIRDNGPGIADGQMQKLFQNFHSTKKRGLGLGLSVCRQLVLAHNGSISIRNRADRGVTVTIRLPLHPHSSCTRPRVLAPQ